MHPALPGTCAVGGHHRGCQVGGGADGRPPPAFGDDPGDPAGEGVLAELEDGVGKLGLGQSRQQFGGGLAPRGVQAHVERSFGLEAEAAQGVVHLGTRETEVSEHAVGTPAGGADRLVGMGEGAVVGADLDAVDGAHPGLGECQVGRVEVKQEHPGPRTAAARQGLGMATSTGGQVGNGPARGHREELKDGVEEDREMSRAGAHAPGESCPGGTDVTGRGAARRTTVGAAPTPRIAYASNARNESIRKTNGHRSRPPSKRR